MRDGGIAIAGNHAGMSVGMNVRVPHAIAGLPILLAHQTMIRVIGDLRETKRYYVTRYLNTANVPYEVTMVGTEWFELDVDDASYHEVPYNRHSAFDDLEEAWTRAREYNSAYLRALADEVACQRTAYHLAKTMLDQKTDRYLRFANAVASTDESMLALSNA